MRAHSIMALLLVVAISLATAVPPASASANLRDTLEDEAQLTPEEEREARDLAEQFGERFRATNDIGPLIDELFVNDFSERLRQAPQGWMPWAILDKSLAPAASRDELRRYYVAVMNFYSLYFRFEEIAEELRKQSEDSEGELKFDDVISPEVLSVLFSDPTFAELSGSEKKDKSDERAKEDENDQPATSVDSAQAAAAETEADSNGATEKEEGGIIKSLAQLNAFSATLEKANELMRQRLTNTYFIQPTPPGDDDDDGTQNEQRSSKPIPGSLNEGEYGYPKETPTINVAVLPFCLRLMRVDGQLKILSAAIYVD